MDKLSMAIIAMEAHVACSNDRLRQAWDIIHAKLVEENGNSLQQLKAEIAALEKKLFAINGADMYERNNIISICAEMRQLSAI